MQPQRFWKIHHHHLNSHNRGVSDTKRRKWWIMFMQLQNSLTKVKNIFFRSENKIVAECIKWLTRSRSFHCLITLPIRTFRWLSKPAILGRISMLWRKTELMLMLIVIFNTSPLPPSPSHTAISSTNCQLRPSSHPAVIRTLPENWLHLTNTATTPPSS